jgi:hypothetical protein
MTREQALELLKQELESKWPWPEVEQMMSVPIKSYKDYANSEYWWNLLGRIFATLKRFSNNSPKSVR